MKSIVIVLLIAFILTSCAPTGIVVPAETTIPTSPTSTFTLTPYVIVTLTPSPTSISQPTETNSQSIAPTSTTFINEKASEDCFLKINLIPEKTRMNEVISAWGNPSSQSSFGGNYDYWHFDFVGAPYIRFKEQVIDTVSFSLKNCSLEKIILKLGEPEKIEISTIISDFGTPYLWTTQFFHYPSLGFSFSRSCDETQNCFIFHPNDTVNGKEFYVLGRAIEDWIGFNSSGIVYDWHGFNVDIEEVENKIEDFNFIDIVTRTPIP